uniref:Uncharacterized protein n=1 Tax=Solanum lycopersicum TaxID=4081 RepID=K4AYZ5_SOLLC
MIFLHVNNTEKDIFNKMMSMNFEIDLSRKVMSVWMFLKTYKLNNFYEKIATCDEMVFKNLYVEAKSILTFFESSSSSTFQDVCPLTSQCLNSSLDEILLNKQVSLIYDMICCDNFNDSYVKMNTPLDSKLNPLAKEWHPTIRAHAAHRSVFMTLTAHPISKKDIFDFFESYLYGMFGPGSVRGVYVYHKGGVRANFGKIVFKSSSICAWLLQGKEAKFAMEPGCIWLREYIPRQF